MNNNNISQSRCVTLPSINEPKKSILKKSVANNTRCINNNGGQLPQKKSNSVHFAENLQVLKYTKASSKTPKDIISSTEKTVHLKQIKKLNTEVNNLINITHCFMTISSNLNELLNAPEIAQDISQKLDNLSLKITKYQNDITRSSCKHHKSKLTNLNTFEK